MRAVFKSKKDGFFGFMVWSPFILSCGFLVLRLTKVLHGPADLPTEAVVIAAVVFCLWGLLVWNKTEYIIDNTHLTLVFALVYSHALNIRHIKSISKGSGPRTMGLSMDSLVIRSDGYQDVYFSPADRDRFLSLILQINPGIQVNVRGFEPKKDGGS